MYIRIYFVFMICTLCSCKKYLDEKSNDNLIVPSTIRDFQALLDDEASMNMQRTPSFAESSADDYYLPEEIYNQLKLEDRNAYIWSNYNYNFPNDWSVTYAPVFNSNYVLDQLTKIQRTSGNELQWDQVKGSALFFRAYYFMNLLWTFSKAYDEQTSGTDLGIALRLGSDFNVPSSRATVKECYNKVLTDAKEAVSLLPNTPQHVMRPSKAAAYGLLARTYLSMRMYESALIYSNLYLSIKSELLDYNNASQVSINSSIPFQPYNIEIAFFATLSTSHTNILPLAARIDRSLYDSYQENDIRKSCFFANNAGWQFKGSYAADPFELFSGIATNEMFLVRAECYARMGNKDAALQDLNALLVKRWRSGTFAPVTAVSNEEALNIILAERRKELLMHGLRWIDIKRLNKEGLNIVPSRILKGQAYSLAVDDNRYALPLPADIIRLTGMPQNPN